MAFCDRLMSGCWALMRLNDVIACTAASRPAAASFRELDHHRGQLRNQAEYFRQRQMRAHLDRCEAQLQVRHIAAIIFLRLRPISLRECFAFSHRVVPGFL